MPVLFDPITLRGLTVRNRVWMSPMCMYSATSGGAPTDWHLAHLVSRAAGGVGMVLQEATAVSAAGRITPVDAGLWDDGLTGPWARIVAAVHSTGAHIGVQLAHAGRKASSKPPWSGSGPVPVESGGWDPVGPTAQPFPELAVPTALDATGIADVITDFGAAAARAVQAGYDCVEIHAAHGYLLHSFLSPLVNTRTDAWGGDLRGRSRLLLAVVAAVRAAVPDRMPVLVRISATDWVDGGWSIADSVELARLLSDAGVDLVDCSSGGAVPAVIPVGPGYQLAAPAAIRAAVPVATAAVGILDDPRTAAAVIDDGTADVVLLGRALLRDPMWPLRVAAELGASEHVDGGFGGPAAVGVGAGGVLWPAPYSRARFRVSAAAGPR